MDERTLSVLRKLGEATQGSFDPSDLSGSDNAKLRAELLAELMGVPSVPRAKAGVYALRSEIESRLPPASGVMLSHRIRDLALPVVIRDAVRAAYDYVIESGHYDSIVFVRMGNFYEAFGDNAINAKQRAGLRMHRIHGLAHVSVPYHEIGQVRQAIEASGREFAVVEPAHATA